MTNFSNEYAKSDSQVKGKDGDLEFWREVGVKADAHKAKNPSELNAFIQGRIGNYHVNAIKEIVEVCELEVGSNENKGPLLKKLYDLPEEQKLFLCNLHDFMSRKKKTINDYYESCSEQKNFTHPLSKLYSLMKISPAHLLSIRTLNLWQNHASGVLMGMDKKITKPLALKIATESTFEDALVNKLYKASGNSHAYKIHSYCHYNNKLIIQLYKLMDDVSKEDFTRAIRNQAVSRVIFSLDMDNNLIEIKSNSYYEERAIKEYLEETFSGIATKIESEVYTGLKQEEVKAAVLEGKTPSGEQVDDFLVDKIKFRESPLENSPSLSFSLENIDVWPSVADAYNKGAISISSVKSIDSISFRSEGTRRTVYSGVLENGNLIFQMDDSRLGTDKKERLEEKFLKRFGIPLYKQLSNIDSLEGSVDMIDYIMRSRNTVGLESIAKQKEKELLDLKLLKEEEIIRSGCKNKNCGFEEILFDISDKKEECPSCESDDVYVYSEVQSNLNKVEIKKFIENKIREICKGKEWTFLGFSKRKINNEEFEFLKLENNSTGKILKVLVSQELMPQAAFNKMKKLLDPTLVITVGQSMKNTERYSNGCFFAVSFGNFYEREKTDLLTLLLKTYNTLTMKTKDFIADAASEAYETIKNKVSDPKSTGYSATDLEDDVYVLLKDFFINVQKWGHENTGQTFPEGIFTLFYEKNVGKINAPHKLAYSYDCKLNLDLLGYNFSIGERDKAIRYIKSLSDSLELSQFTDSNHLDGHIFIGNKFKEKNSQNTYEEIIKAIKQTYDTDIIFITTDVLLYLHEKYRENFSLIEGSRNLFMFLLSRTLKELNGKFISNDHIDFIIKKTLSQAKKQVANFDEITADLKEELLQVTRS
ncbi:hypothetical protein FQV26_10375 [Planococcus sp. CPCC 101016]|uniref:hypothetical protein n=1 Tax=Planococcus sp. CPCC 101016 TaxID=2599617 RepID=UPI0011B4C668|nr:hypothetical protein [Planococcus sp. CPCC 101016]TWT08189.1 hypothetical protein FQV26_10375 [Planococcus sp. CPCC 101016]